MSLNPRIFSVLVGRRRVELTLSWGLLFGGGAFPAAFGGWAFHLNLGPLTLIVSPEPQR